METKTLLSGLIGSFIGGLLVSTAATTFDRPEVVNNSELSMGGMTESLKDKTGDEYDRAFLAHMIDHHKSALDMARLSAQNAKHDDIKVLSEDIMKNQAVEIKRMEQWQREWGYTIQGNSVNHSSH